MNKASQITSPGSGLLWIPKTTTVVNQWDSTNWKAVYKRINKIQTRITKATQRGNRNLAKKLQYLLTSSFDAKLLAVKKVTSNKGKRTSGIDRKLWSTPSSKYKAALSLKTKGYKASPLRRIYIEKKGKKKKRPLGIPTMYDRAIQALYAMALDPIAETTADKTSFGFRKKRSTHDAAQHIFNYSALNKGNQWILEGDIKGCFDNINHQWLMENIPIEKKILKQLLTAGFIYKRKLFPTETGTPQGGILSPIMANITLSEEKTLITNIDDGFDFLGWNFRKYNGKLLIKPSKDSIRKVTETLKTMIRLHRGKSQTELIKSINPIITGWTNYHKTACAKKIFAKLDNAIFNTLWRWAKRRHPNKSRKWIKNRYWKRTLFNNWIFSDGNIELKRAAHTNIVRHRIIKFDANPYLPEFRRYYYYRDQQRMQGRKYEVAANGIFGE